MSETIPTLTVARGDAVGLWIFMVAGAGIAMLGRLVSRGAASSRCCRTAMSRVLARVRRHDGRRADRRRRRTHRGRARPRTHHGAVAARRVAVGALVIEQLVFAVAVISVVVLPASGSPRNVSRSRVFSRTNTRARRHGGIRRVHRRHFAVPFFGNMAANGAFAGLSDQTFDNVILSVDPFAAHPRGIHGSPAQHRVHGRRPPAARHRGPRLMAPAEPDDGDRRALPARRAARDARPDAHPPRRARRRERGEPRGAEERPRTRHPLLDPAGDLRGARLRDRRAARAAARGADATT